MNILKAKISIVGVRPLLWHHFGPDAIPVDGKRERTGVAGNDPEEWKRTVLKTPEGVLYVEGTYAFGAIRDGAKYTKKGRGSIQSAMSATLQIEEMIIETNRRLPDPITQDSSQDVYLDIRSVRNPTTKGRNVRYRVASSPGWKMTFTAVFDKTIISRHEMEAVLRDTGALVGIGSGRAIGFGRFEVEGFEVS